MSMPTKQAVFLPFLKFLADQQLHRVKDVRSQLERHFQLTPEECANDGHNQFHSFVGNAINHLKAARLIEQVGISNITITPRGLDVVRENPEKIDTDFLRQYPEYRPALNAPKVIPTDAGAANTGGCGDSKALPKTAHVWENVEEKFPVGSIIQGTVINLFNVGALIEIEGGITGLLHKTDMHWIRKIGHPSEVVQNNQQITCKVLSVDKEKRRMTLGLKQLSEDLWATRIPQKYQVGSIIQGTVRNLVNYGAFIEIEEGIASLLHISNMHWTRKIEHPSEVVQSNQQITCKVLSVDKEKRRMALGLKQLSEDPWVTRIPQKYQVGQIVIGTVVKMMDFGVFIEIEDDLTGLLHVSELAKHQAENPEDAVEVGKKIEVKVIRVDLDKRKINLGSKLAESAQLQELPLCGVNPLTLMGTRVMNKIHELFG